MDAIQHSSIFLSARELFTSVTLSSMLLQHALPAFTLIHRHEGTTVVVL